MRRLVQVEPLLRSLHSQETHITLAHQLGPSFYSTIAFLLQVQGLGVQPVES